MFAYDFHGNTKYLKNKKSWTLSSRQNVDVKFRDMNGSIYQLTIANMMETSRLLTPKDENPLPYRPKDSPVPELCNPQNSGECRYIDL